MSVVRIKAPTSVLAPFINFVYMQMVNPDTSSSSSSTPSSQPPAPTTDTQPSNSQPSQTDSQSPATPATLIASDDNSYIEIEAPAILFEGFFATALINLPQQDSGDPEAAE